MSFLEKVREAAAFLADKVRDNAGKLVGTVVGAAIPGVGPVAGALIGEALQGWLQRRAAADEGQLKGRAASQAEVEAHWAGWKPGMALVLYDEHVPAYRRMLVSWAGAPRPPGQIFPAPAQSDRAIGWLLGATLRGDVRPASTMGAELQGDVVTVARAFVQSALDEETDNVGEDMT